MEFKQISEQSFMIYFAADISESIFNQVNTVSDYLKSLAHPYIQEIVTSYRAILVYFDGMAITYEALLDELSLTAHAITSSEQNKPRRIVNIPVLYGGKWGPDLEYVAEYHKLSVEEVIQCHIEGYYLVYMIGFMPGFPFLGGLSPRIHTPRKDEPRLKIPAGSVGIANNQTGLYPADSPGGWQIIGRTPIDVFDLNRDPKILYRPGDKIKFYAINEEQFLHIQKYVEKGQLNYDEWVKIGYEH
ncbi:5-oxoprolinase subunit PxpB [Staphylococcus americanisciuri]|uniref:5-oxoprolinase subunit PxpB n=1 Tax=Staphylococcus americanisciuri TaxID=2973940 RepID=A0ABT2EZE1_9STAP|nr:5-oxoprolinase subunit PxpB [Staphylococcus americanisciuri]MCS4485588.1 5-oxoprolinase subunit PxpB [Staphylococcus americanisciuri]